MTNEQDDLEFQKVLDSGISEMSNVPYSTSYNETQNLSTAQQDSNTTTSSSIFSIDYYKQFFNVTTQDVINRILMAINPANANFISEADPPDLYGPIWVSSTSIFFMLILGNLTAWSDKGSKWQFNFYDFFISFILTFLFVFGGPFAYIFFTKMLSPPSVIQLTCLFGYSTIFMIPTAFFCMVVGLKADYIMSIAGSATMGASVFYKLHKNSNSPGRLVIPNAITAAVSMLLCFLVELLLFK